MTRLTWSAVGSRFFETGVDQGVLYLANGSGIAWPGLTSVSETPSGGEPRPYYLDGVKYLNIAGSEEFEATLNAFASPPEFAPFDGIASVQNGLFATQQPRQAFGFSYRTRVGNDTDGAEYAYKIHLVYNALAAPTDRTRTSLGTSVDPTAFSWAITTLPPSITGKKPTAHLVIDSRYTPKQLLKYVEDIIYGSDAGGSRLPTPNELVTLFQSQGPLMRTNLLSNPTWRSTSGTAEIRRNFAINPAVRSAAVASEIRRNYITDPNCSDASKWASYTGVGSIVASAAAAYSGSTGLLVTCGPTFNAVPRITTSATQVLTFAVGDNLTLQAKVRLAGTGWQPTAAPYFVLRGTLTAGGEWTNGAYTIQNLSGGWMLVTISAVIPAGANGNFTVNIGFNNAGVLTDANQAFHVDEIQVEKSGGTVQPFFTGGSAAANGITYSWAGTANASASIASAPTLTGRYFSSNGVVHQVDIGGKKWAATIPGTFLYAAATGVAGKFYCASARIAGPVGSAFTISSTDNLTGAWLPPYNGTIPAGGEIVVSLASAAANTNNAAAAMMFGLSGASSLVCRMSDVLIEEVPAMGLLSQPSTYFDGSSPAGSALTYSWTGTVDLSQSIATGPGFATAAPFAAYSGTVGVVGWQIDPAGVYRLLAKRSQPIGTILTFGSQGQTSASPGLFYAGKFKVRQATSLGAVSLRVTLSAYDNLQNHAGFLGDVNVVVPTDGSWLEVSVPPILVAPGTIVTARWLIYEQTTTILAGTELEFKEAIIEQVSGLGVEAGTYFDGSTPDANANWYSWAGAPDLSASLLNSWN